MTNGQNSINLHFSPFLLFTTRPSSSMNTNFIRASHQPPAYQNVVPLLFNDVSLLSST